MSCGIPLTIEEYFQKRVHRFPKFYESNLQKVFLRILTNSEELFHVKRSSSHLAHLVCVQYFLQKKLIQKMQSFPQRYLFLKCFKSEVDEKDVISVALVVNLSLRNETLEERHIFKALTRFLPGIRIIPRSFYTFLEKSNLILFCYLEIEKLRGKPLDFRDIKLLRKSLVSELKQSIQSLVPSLLVPYNEEEVYKNILQLTKELKSEKDLPQVMISFQAQGQEFLCFHVIIVRAKRKNNLPSIDFLSSSIRISLQRNISLGTSQKEAIIFLIEVNSDLFFRKNWSIDLRQARNYIVKAIEGLIGPFRDYNGGLFLQQNKQLEKIKIDLKRKFDFPNLLIEEVFYGFHPPVFQPLLSSSIANKLFAQFIYLKKKELPNEGVIIEKKKHKGSLILSIKTDSSKNRDEFLQQIENFIGQDSSIGHSSIQFEGIYYLFVVNLNPNSTYLRSIEKFKQSLKKVKLGEEKRKSYRILRINYQEGDIPSLNPHIGTEMYCRNVEKALFEGLTRLNPKGIPEPAAAQKIKISSCKTIYTFTLRKHHWSNGELVTAYDFERAWKKALLPNTNCLRSDLFYCIKNAKLVNQGQLSINEIKIQAVNSKTLIVQLEHPAPHFLHLVAHPIFSPLYKEEEEPVYFNGPFIIKQWQRDHLLHLTSNPFYWDKKNVQLQDIYISMIKNIHTITEMFEKEELDWIGDPFSILPFKTLPSSYNKKPKIEKVNRIYAIQLNTLSPPFQSANIRRALAFAINRKQIITELFNGCLPQFSPIPDSNFKKQSEYDGNIQLAQHYFEEGLKELNLTYDSFPEITFLYYDGTGQEKLAKIIQSQIKAALRINLKIINASWDNFLSILHKKQYQLAGYFLISPYFYRYSHLELFRAPLYLSNDSEWNNKEYQSFLDLAQQAKDPRKKNKLLRNAEQILINEMPVIAIFRSVYRYYLNKKIKKIIIAQNGDVDLKWTTFKNRS